MEQHAERDDQRDCGQGGQKGERCPAAAAQLHDARRAGGARAEPVIALAAATLRGFDGQHQHDQGDQREAEHGQRGAVEGGAEADVDGAGEGVEAHHRDGTEVADDVEGDEQRAGGERDAQLRQGDAQEGLPAALAERAAGFFEGRIEVAQPGAQHQQDVGISEEGEHEERAAEAVELGQRVDAQRREQLLQRSVGAQRGDHGESGDVGGYGERDDGDGAPPARAGQVGALGQPGAGQRDQGGGGGHGGGQGDRVEQQAQGVVAEQIGPGVGVGRGGADDEIDERDAGGRADEQREQPDDGDAAERAEAERARRAGQREAAEAQQFRPVIPPAREARGACWLRRIRSA